MPLTFERQTDKPFEDTRMADHREAWWQRGGIRVGRRFAGGGNSMQYSSGVSCRVIASCIAKLRVLWLVEWID